MERPACVGRHNDVGRLDRGDCQTHDAASQSMPDDRAFSPMGRFIALCWRGMATRNGRFEVTAQQRFGVCAH